MYKTDSDIQKRVQEHLELALNRIDSKEYDWFVICAQGSMNYDLMDEESDVDTKLLVVPSLENIALNRKPISKTMILENKEHCDVKDIREYFKIVRKMNVNFVEIFFTDYYVVNPRYADLWMELQRRREEIARANSYRFLKACKGMVHEKAHALCHPYPSKLNLLEEYGWDGKQLCHAMRIHAFAKHFLYHNEDYKDCLVLSGLHTLLMEIKRNQYPKTKELAEYMMDRLVEMMDKFEAEWNKNHKDEFYAPVSEFLDEILVETISRNVKRSLNG